jgi:hypothetical protein
MIDFIKSLGICGILSLVSTLALAVIFVAAICRSRSPRSRVKFGIIALLPLLIGLLGTAAGYSKVSRVDEQVESFDQAAVQRSREFARYTTYLGLGCTGLLWVIVVVGASLKTRNAEQGVLANRGGS